MHGVNLNTLRLLQPMFGLDTAHGHLTRDANHAIDRGSECQSFLWTHGSVTAAPVTRPPETRMFFSDTHIPLRISMLVKSRHSLALLPRIS
jgi:hypothetical protein